MPEKAKDNDWEPKGTPGEPGWEPAKGVRLKKTLRGHTHVVNRIAWSPDGKRLASPSEDGSIRIWSTETGRTVRIIDGHHVGVLSVSWSPDGQHIASGGDDKTLRIWESSSGEHLQTLHTDAELLKCVAWSPDGRKLVSASALGEIRMCDADSGNCLKSLIGHTSQVTSVAWSPCGRNLASSSDDETARIWDAGTGVEIHRLSGEYGPIYSVDWLTSTKFGDHLVVLAHYNNVVSIWDSVTGIELRVLEGHTGGLNCAAASKDGRWLASKAGDDSVRLWRCDTWQTSAVIHEEASTSWPPGVAFHPHAPFVATVGSEAGAPHGLDSIIHIWELDENALLHKNQIAEPETTTAKIVLVGDSGVGKTGLGWTLTHGEFKEHSSTHGQQFWMLDQLDAKRNVDGVQCEAVLWDLAGQPDYRLIHALHVADADLALILFDPCHPRDPLGSVNYWLGQLPAECPKILVPARVDRGSPKLTREELAVFCQRSGISGGFVETSAANGTGLDELLEQMKREIPWDSKTAITTTATFKRIKEFVLLLKEDREGRRVVVTPAELRAMLEEEDPSPFTDAEMMTAVERVSSHGYVRVLKNSDGEERVLLVPELLNNLAASFIIEARRNPKGLGAIEERKIRDGSYRFEEMLGLEEKDRELLADATIEAFLSNRLSYRCFREEFANQHLLVFPELINLNKPEKDDGLLVDDVFYVVSGATENTYAALVVTLGYTNTFRRADQWKHQARYEVGEGLICGFRRQEEETGDTSYTLYFSENLDEPVKRMFQGVFETSLARKDLVTVLRFPPVVCDCGTALDRGVMRKRLGQGKEFAFCEECAERLSLPSAEEPLKLTKAVREASATADHRAVFEELVYKLKSKASADDKVDQKKCFLSYAWRISGLEEEELHVERWVLRLANDLRNAGHVVFLDQTHNEHFGASIPRFVEEISKSDRVLVVGTPLYLKKHENEEFEEGTIVAAEMDLIADRLCGPEVQKKTVIPMLLSGTPTKSLPAQLRRRNRADFRKEKDYFIVAFDLMLTLYGYHYELPGIRDWRAQLRGDVFR